MPEPKSSESDDSGNGGQYSDDYVDFLRYLSDSPATFNPSRKCIDDFWDSFRSRKSIARQRRAPVVLGYHKFIREDAFAMA